MLTKDFVAIERRFEKNKIVIDWFLGKRCNYDCTYCTPDVHDKTSAHLPLDHLKSSVDSLLNHFDCDDIKIGFTGGEPTIHPDFMNFAEYLHNKNIGRITVTSNGSQTLKYYLKLHSFIKNITFSQHFEFSKNAHFLPKMKAIYEALPEGKAMTVQVMAHAQNFEAVQEAVEYYQEHNVPYTLRRIRFKGNSVKTSHDYSEEQLRWFFSNQPQSPSAPNARIFYAKNVDYQSSHVHVNEISGAELNHFEGWTCWAGIQHLHIDADGTIYRGNCQQGGPLGKIGDKNFSLPKEPIVCKRHRCFCGPEISINKVKTADLKFLLETDNVSV